MARVLSCLALALGLLPWSRADIGNICSPGHASEGGCAVDGTGCKGESVELLPYTMSVSNWDSESKTPRPYGHLSSYAIMGGKDTWQMYIHGPHVVGAERADGLGPPPMYVFGTFTNQIYRFENFSMPSASGREPLRATQKVVGHALAPSTGFAFQAENSSRPKGMFVAEGQPFWVSNIDTMPPHQVGKGGVQYMGSRAKNCTSIFPTNPIRKIFGQVVNTVDCHTSNGVCFFSVWKFYDDQKPIWNPFSEKVANDCLYYCILDYGANDEAPRCLKTAVVVDEHGERICHKDGVGAVHGMTVGNTDASDPSQFDILLVFTGKATMTNGESSMKKVRVQAVSDGTSRDIKVLSSKPFGTDLFQHYAPKGWDVGGDHAWVDATGKWVWVSCFRSKGVGVHMLNYETGELVHSVTGIGSYVPNQYTYTAGIHGVGTLGQPGSYLAVATCSCHSLKVCIPTVPWHLPVPEQMWSTGVFFILDLSSLKPFPQTEVLI